MNMDGNILQQQTEAYDNRTISFKDILLPVWTFYFTKINMKGTDTFDYFELI